MANVSDNDQIVRKLGDKLKYGQLKDVAYPSHRILNETNQRSGSTFHPQQQVEFTFPQDKLNEFVDINDSLRIKWPVTVTADAYLDRAGAYSTWEKLEIYQGSQMLTNVNKENLLICALKDMGQISESYAGSTGKNQEGFEKGLLRGEKLLAGVEREFMMSIHCSDLAMTTPKRDLYLGSKQDITIRITLAHQDISLYTDAGGASTYSVTEPRLITNNTYMEEVTMKAIDMVVKNQYQMLSGSYEHADFVITAGSPSANLKLPFAKKSMERIIFTVRQSSTVSNIAKMSLGGRTTGNMIDFQFKVKGKNVPQSPIRIENDGTEVFWHLLQADNVSSSQQLGNDLMNAFDVSTYGPQSTNPEVVSTNPFMKNCLVGENGSYGKGLNATAPEASDIGKFLGGLSFESSLVSNNGSPLYSGVNTTSGDMYFNCHFGNAGAGAFVNPTTGIGTNPQDLTIDFFCLSTEYLYYIQESRAWSDSV